MIRALIHVADTSGMELWNGLVVEEKGPSVMQFQEVFGVCEAREYPKKARYRTIEGSDSTPARNNTLNTASCRSLGSPFIPPSCLASHLPAPRPSPPSPLYLPDKNKSLIP